MTIYRARKTTKPKTNISRLTGRVDSAGKKTERKKRMYKQNENKTKI